MSAQPHCYNNAPAESFFSLLKRELIRRDSYATEEEAKSDGITIHWSTTSLMRESAIAVLEFPKLDLSLLRLFSHSRGEMLRHVACRRIMKSLP
jgi:transposase InsO family protein